MIGAWLSELLTTIYAETLVSHILSRKAVWRALRVHFVCAAFMSKLDAVLPVDGDQLTCQPLDSADIAEADEGEITFGIGKVFASVKNEAKLLDIEVTLREQYVWCVSR